MNTVISINNSCLIAIEIDCLAIAEVLHLLNGQANRPDAGGCASSDCIIIRAYHPPLQYHVMSSIAHRGNEVETMRGKRGQQGLEVASRGRGLAEACVTADGAST